MKGSLEVMGGGLQTTVQDLGRVGFRKYGVPVSGVMDEHSCRLANWLVGNAKEAPVLELTLQGGSFKFQSNATIGITGAEAEMNVNGSPVQPNKTIEIKPGEVLNIGRIKNGCRIYLSISGEWEIEKIMGSYSTCLSANFGGFEGHALTKGDVLSWTSPKKLIEVKTVPQKMIPHYASRQTIRIIKGPEWDWLSEAQQTEFLAADFIPTSQSNRMGIRLQSSFVPDIIKGEMISSPVVPGIIQLPSDGAPIILIKDGQSVGGYPRIAKVIDADLWRIGQLWHRNEINFSLISIEEAKELYKYYLELWDKLNS
ncbi:MAG: biotin-dependent carboxyltransferase family protein [Gracilimonas sp.]